MTVTDLRTYLKSVKHYSIKVHHFYSVRFGSCREKSSTHQLSCCKNTHLGNQEHVTWKLGLDENSIMMHRL